MRVASLVRIPVPHAANSTLLFFCSVHYVPCTHSDSLLPGCGSQPRVAGGDTAVAGMAAPPGPQSRLRDQGGAAAAGAGA
jgi:hypothetical protein